MNEFDLIASLLNTSNVNKNKVHKKTSETLSSLILSLLSNNSNKNNKINKENKELITNDGNDSTDENNLQYEKVYYFDKSGFPMDECECDRINSECKAVVESCCLIEIPRGFKLPDCSPRMCFNLSKLNCVKVPIMQRVDLEVCEGECPKQCDVVAGYEIRAVGEVNFSLSIPICPIDGFCTKNHSYACCSSTVQVNEIISHTCCPKPCNCSEPCVDWTYGYFCTTPVEKGCFSYVKVKMGVALEFTGNCECDEE